MNREYVLWNLREAKKSLDSTISQIERDPFYEDEDLIACVLHLYHHINTAWNAREASSNRAYQCSARDFERWRRFPKDLEVL